MRRPRAGALPRIGSPALVRRNRRGRRVSSCGSSCPPREDPWVTWMMARFRDEVKKAHLWWWTLAWTPIAIAGYYRNGFWLYATVPLFGFAGALWRARKPAGRTDRPREESDHAR